MKEHPPLVAENKKRAAFKRFSQIGVTGLAVISMSAFTNLSANELPIFAENDSIKKFLANDSIKKGKESSSANMLTDTADGDYEIRWFDASYQNIYKYTNNNAYCDYYNYHNYSNTNYTNNYSNSQNGNYTNNYSNTAN
jgi:hypothetical protein